MRRLSSLMVGVIGLGFSALAAGSAAGAPIVITLGDFSGAETVITFDAIAPFTPITTQFQASDGVTFAGGLFGGFGGVAQNFPPFSTNTNPITITFDETIHRVGFDLFANSGEGVLVTVEAYAGGSLVQTGQLQFTVSGAPVFAGIGDLDGIDQLVLSGVPVGGTGGFIIDNFRFESNPIPEPSASLLFPVGMLVAASSLRRRRQKLA